MGPAKKKLLNYAQLMRLSNLPTCLTNVLTGAAIGLHFQEAHILKIAAVAVSVCLYYCGGMILNDVCDIKYDREHKPQRPIAKGDVSFRSALVLAILFFLAATAIISFIDVFELVPASGGIFSVISVHALIPALGLFACIVLYNLLHKKYSFSIVLMALCRMLVYITAAAAVAAPSQAIEVRVNTWPFAGILGFYTLVITVIARGEDTSGIGIRKWLAVMLLPTFFVILFFVRPENEVYATVALLLLIAWTLIACRFLFIKPPKVKHAVLTLLSGMCLLDAWFLSLMDRPMLALIAILCFIITYLGHKRISGT